MWGFAIAGVFAVLYVVFRLRDRRLLRNGFFFVATAFFVVIGLFEALTPVVPAFNVAALVLVLALPVLVLVLGVFLLLNGLRMVRRERRTPANLLSLVAGIAVFALPLVEIVLIRHPSAPSIALAAVIAFVSAYLGLVFLAFLTASLLYRRATQRVRAEAIVVLGAQVIDGKVPPLLRSRLDRALVLYRAAAARGQAPVMIPSGGQGSDETRAEGDAMADYLLAQGVPAGDVAAETRATTTRENLLFAREVQEAVGRPGRVVVVTNDYHALRAAMLAREIGSDAEVVGAPTARYYVPSAFLREFVAVLVAHRGLHLVAAIPFVGIVALLGAALAQQH